MYCRHKLPRLSALGLLILSSIVVVSTLVATEPPARAAKSASDDRWPVRAFNA